MSWEQAVGGVSERRKRLYGSVHGFKDTDLQSFLLLFFSQVGTVKNSVASEQWQWTHLVQKAFPIDRQAQHRAAVWSASIEVLAASPVFNSGSLWGLPRALKLAAHLWVAHKELLAFEVLFVLGVLSFAKKKHIIAQARLCTKGAWVHCTVPNAV